MLRMAITEHLGSDDFPETMKLFIFTAAFYDRDYEQKIQKLQHTCDLYNIDMVAYGRGEFFSFYDSKIVKMGNVLDQVKNEYTHALYLDCADAFFLTGLEEIIEKYWEMGSPDLLVSGEKGCHPFEDMTELFPGSKPWRYMNPGMYIGKIPAIMNMLSACTGFYQLKTNDQGHWYEAYNKYRFPLVVDSECRIFQTMSDTHYGEEVDLRNGRLYNRVTDQYPCVVHFNGGKDNRVITLMETVFDYTRKGETL